MRKLTSAAPADLLEIVSRGYVDGKQGDAQAADAGWLTWAYDPSLTSSSSLISGGVLTMVRLVNPAPITVSNLYVYLLAAGASLTNVGFGLYNANGNLLTSTVNTGSTATGANATSFQVGGLKTIPITPQALPAGAFYVGFWATGTTLPSLLRTATGGSFNAGYTLAAGTGLRYAVANTGLTTAAPATATQTGNAAASYWAAAA